MWAKIKRWLWVLLIAFVSYAYIGCNTSGPTGPVFDTENPDAQESKDPKNAN